MKAMAEFAMDFMALKGIIKGTKIFKNSSIGMPMKMGEISTFQPAIVTTMVTIPTNIAIIAIFLVLFFL